jgi:acetyl-CoA carboxylase carboxyl transferase subunit alpha
VAAEQLKLTAIDMKGFGLVDEIVPEPEGGAHWNYNEAAQILKSYIVKAINEIKDIPADRRIQMRIDKFGRMGEWQEQ